MFKHIAIYTRVSTRAQDQRSQLPDLDRWGCSQLSSKVLREFAR